jgi:ABC-type dipeptide/oligopeptide/nickel transport system permease component
MLGYICGRILALMMILLAVSVIVFSLMHSVPGGPFDERKGRLPPAAKANILKKYGLDQPVWKQYINYMSHAVRFDFGIPYQRPQPLLPN